MTKEAVLFIADTHINSTFGLCKPGARADDGNSVQLNTVQKWLWYTWEHFLDEAFDLMEGCNKTLVLDGDIIELDSKNRSWQTMTKNPSTTLTYGIEVLEPVVSRVDTLFILRGTEAHTGKSAWGEEELAKDLGAEVCEETDTFSWWHLRADFGGVSFDVAHHYPMGHLPWTYGNAANKLAATTMIEYAEWDEAPPDVVIRAHNHRFADSGRTLKTRGMFLPCWQYHTAYLHRLGKPNARPHIGGCVFICEDGEYKFYDLLYKPKRSGQWKRK